MEFKYQELKIGGDPRSCLDFIAIRDEINKQYNPNASKINFNKIEQLSFKLFSSNGVDLQTASYFVFSQTKLYGIDGFYEACKLLEYIIVNSWENLWPFDELAKIEMLNWINNKIGKDVREFKFNNEHIFLLSKMELLLKNIIDKLNHHDVHLINIYHYIFNKRNSLEQTHKTQDLTVQNQTKKILIYTDDSVVENKCTKSYTQDKTSKSSSDIFACKMTKFKPYLSFIVGVIVTTFIFNYVSFQEDEFKPINLELFKPLSQSAVKQLSTNLRIKDNSLNVEEQLTKLRLLSPLATRYYGENLTAIMKETKSNNATTQIIEQWQLSLELQSNDKFMQEGYFHAQQLLQKLADDLNQAEAHNRSITISKLKTDVYNIQNHLNQEIPLEELLRQLANYQHNHHHVAPILIKNIDDRFNTLLSYYLKLSKIHHENNINPPNIKNNTN